MASPFLIVEHVSKRFGPTQALSDVSVSMAAGEVHALMGENGAGKSTLGKAIAGLHKPDSGRIVLGGRELVPGSVHDAFEAGVRIVHQELAQCPNLSVAENLSLHALPTRMGLLDRGAMNRRAERLLMQLAPEIDVQAPLGSLAPGRRQIVQIASALDDRSEMAGAAAGPSAAGAKVIVFDEPTSSLSISEADRLIGIIRQLSTQGILCIYVSHRMGEIFAACDRVTVLRDGKWVGTSVIKDINERTLVSQMIGREIDPAARVHRAAAGGTAAPALEVRGLGSRGKLSNVTLAVKPGEIVGVGGLVGSGRSELLDAIFGLDRHSEGAVIVAGRRLKGRDPREAIEAGLGYVPEDRRLQGLFFQLGVDENIIAPLMGMLAKLGLRRRGAERSEVGSRISRFRVKTATPQSLPGELSGGNQQKLLIARWMHDRTRVLLLDEPTRGIDVGTKSEVYRLVREAADQGLAVLLVSSEMPELLALSDRIVVMCEGELTGELRDEQMTQENILRLATVKHGAVAQ